MDEIRSECGLSGAAVNTGPVFLSPMSLRRRSTMVRGTTTVAGLSFVAFRGPRRVGARCLLRTTAAAGARSVRGEEPRDRLRRQRGDVGVDADAGQQVRQRGAAAAVLVNGVWRTAVGAERDEEPLDGGSELRLAYSAMAGRGSSRSVCRRRIRSANDPFGDGRPFQGSNRQSGVACPTSPYGLDFVACAGSDVAPCTRRSRHGPTPSGARLD